MIKTSNWRENFEDSQLQAKSEHQTCSSHQDLLFILSQPLFVPN